MILVVERVENLDYCGRQTRLASSQEIHFNKSLTSHQASGYVGGDSIIIIESAWRRHALRRVVPPMRGRRRHGRWWLMLMARVECKEGRGVRRENAGS